MFDYIGSFESAITALQRERRYRVFADLERKVGEFPHALWNSPSGAPRRRATPNYTDPGA